MRASSPSSTTTAAAVPAKRTGPARCASVIAIGPGGIDSGTRSPSKLRKPTVLAIPTAASSSAMRKHSSTDAPLSTSLAVSSGSSRSGSAWGPPAAWTCRLSAVSRSRWELRRSKSIALPFRRTQQRARDHVELHFDAAPAQSGDHRSLELRVAHRPEFEALVFEHLQCQFGHQSLTPHDRHPGQGDLTVFRAPLAAGVDRLIHQQAGRFARCLRLSEASLDAVAIQPAALATDLAQTLGHLGGPRIPGSADPLVRQRLPYDAPAAVFRAQAHRRRHPPVGEGRP